MVGAGQWVHLLLYQVGSSHGQQISTTLADSQLSFLRDSGVAAIESLMDRSGTFDYILLETSGLAEPGNIAPLFWVDEGLGSSIYLDGIVTLVDAKNILRTLNETSTHHTADGTHNTPELTTAHLQISHADVVVVNKSDLVTAAELSAVIERVEAINGLAKIHITQQGKVPELEGFLLDLHAYDALGALDTVDKHHNHLDPVLLRYLECGAVLLMSWHSPSLRLQSEFLSCLRIKWMP